MSTQKIERLTGLGLAVVIALFAMALIWRNRPFEDPNLTVALRTLMSLMCGVIGGTIPGWLNVKFSIGGLILRAGGAMGFAIVTYTYTPTVLPALKTATLWHMERFETGDVKQALQALNGYWHQPVNFQSYQATRLEDRPKLVGDWLNNDIRVNAVDTVTKAIHLVHLCIAEKKCEQKALCDSPMFSEADNFLIFFDPYLMQWASFGYESVYQGARQFIICDCYERRNAVRCPDHPSMCNAPSRCI